MVVITTTKERGASHRRPRHSACSATHPVAMLRLFLTSASLIVLSATTTRTGWREQT
jgi:hypothetical protein